MYSLRTSSILAYIVSPPPLFWAASDMLGEYCLAVKIAQRSEIG